MSRVARVMTHRRPSETADAIEPLVAAAARAGYTLRVDEDEARKLGLSDGAGPVEVDQGGDDGVDLCVVLGGDGTILAGLRRFARSDVPVFAVNFGEVGFLATLEPDEMADGLARAFAHDFERLGLPAVVLDGPDGEPHVAINDVSIHRKVGERVALLSYSVEGFEVGAVRCDGLVVATPAGSTGYNLANGGPVLAWGVEGYVVSFIAPHSLTARALVVAPSDRLEVTNRSGDVLDVTVDGRPIREIGPGEVVAARFRHDASCLAQVPGSSFYRRLREKFGRLSS